VRLTRRLLSWADSRSWPRGVGTTARPCSQETFLTTQPGRGVLAVLSFPGCVKRCSSNDDTSSSPDVSAEGPSAQLIWPVSPPRSWNLCGGGTDQPPALDTGSSTAFLEPSAAARALQKENVSQGLGGNLLSGVVNCSLARHGLWF